MNIPATVTAGDSWAWSDSDARYPAGSGWSLVYTLFRYGQAPITLTGVPNADAWDFTVTPASSDILSGEWRWSCAVSNGSARYTLATGTLQVKPNYASASASSDFRGPIEKQYDNIVSAINRLSSREVLTVTVNGRTVTYKNIGELEKSRAALYPQMLAEKAASSGTKISPRILTRFS